MVIVYHIPKIFLYDFMLYLPGPVAGTPIGCLCWSCITTVICHSWIVFVCLFTAFTFTGSPGLKASLSDSAVSYDYFRLFIDDDLAALLLTTQTCMLISVKRPRP